MQHCRLGESSWKATQGKRTWGCCLTAAEHEPVCAAGDLTLWILHPILGSSLQDRHWGAGVSPEKGSEAGEGSYEEQRREVQLFRLEKRRLRGALLPSTVTWKEAVTRALAPSPQWQVTGWEDIASSCSRRGSGWTSSRISSQLSTEQTFQGEGRGTNPGRVQEITENYT